MTKSVSSIRVFGFKWKVENALSIDSLESDEFALCESRWRLHLSQDGLDSLHAFDFIDISLSKLNPEKLNCSYIIQYFIEGRNGEPVKTDEWVLDNPDFATEEIWFIHRDEFLEKRDMYLVDGTLTFVIVFIPQNVLGKDTIDQKVPDKSIIETSVNVANFENLTSDFYRLLDDGVEPDVILQCGDRSFPAHKTILSDRSEVFSGMVRSDMAENRTGVIQISDMDASVLHHFLHYIYSGKLSDLSVDTAQKLYAAADKYFVESVKKSCAKFMQENLTKENACKILLLADIHGDKYLKESALCFITNVELLRNKDVWFEFHNEHPKLAGEALHHAYEAKCLSKVN